MTGMLLIALILVIRNHRRVLFLLTGEEHVRLQVADAFWVACCRCGGFCDGEWTRYLSHACCFWHKGLRGANLKRGLGQMLGILPIPIRVSNIVVGDLPTHANTSDFYVSIEVGTNPHQITSVAEDFNPKVVHFSETMTLRVKFTPLESNIRFVVKELGTLGSSELCECYINPMLMMKWRYSQKGPMRFRMEPLERNQDGVFPIPPWILLDIGAEPEWIPSSGSKIRIMEMSSGTAREFTPREFKSKYTLLNTFGMATHEPDENKVGNLDRAKRLRTSVEQLHCFALIVISVFFFIARWYTFTCYRGYVHIEVLRSNGLAFPVEPFIKRHYIEQCGFDKTLRPIGLFTEMAASVSEFTSEAKHEHLRVWTARDVSHGIVESLLHLNSTSAPSAAPAPRSTGSSALADGNSGIAGIAGSAGSAAGPTTSKPGPYLSPMQQALPTRRLRRLQDEDWGYGEEVGEEDPYYEQEAEVEVAEAPQDLPQAPSMGMGMEQDSGLSAQAGFDAASEVAQEAGASVDKAAQAPGALAVGAEGSGSPGLSGVPVPVGGAEVQARVTEQVMMQRCEPTFKRVAETCAKLPFGAQWPVSEWWLIFTTIEIPCTPQTCEWARLSKNGDVLYCGFLLLWIASFAIVLALLDRKHDNLHQQVHGVH